MPSTQTLPLARVVDAVMRASVESVFVIDADRQLIGLSRAAAEWLQASGEGLLGQPIDSVLRFAEGDTDGLEAATAPVDPLGWTLEQGWEFESFDHLLALVSGRELPVRAGFSAILGDGGEILGAVCSLSDFSAAADAARALHFARNNDPVTGLGSREQFDQKLEACHAANAPPNRPYWVACIDIDQFRVINDAAGHMAGDTLLMQMASAFRKLLRGTDTLVRFGGDEFGIVFEPCSRNEVERLVERLMEAARDLGFCWNGTSYPSTVSVGIAPLSASGNSPHRAVALAERARYVAKEDGRDHCCFATDDHPLAEREVEVAAVSRILAALHEGRFVLYSQDVVGVDDASRPLYREILVRMVDEKGELVPPERFIPGAERYFMMDAIDRWVVEETIGILSRRKSDGVVCAVNLSGQSLSNIRFRQWLITHLRERPEVCRTLCFEITETAAVRHLLALRDFFAELIDLGVRLALDDFGVGVSSLSYLSEIPACYLKIDGRFVRDLESSPFNRHIVRAVCDISAGAGMQSIAEHVEHAEHLAALAELGVTMAQGWGIARERPFQELDEQKLDERAARQQ